MDVSKKWLKSAQLYKFFARTYDGLDFSDAAGEAMYHYESSGIGHVNHYDKVNGLINGYAVGKHLMDIQLAMWWEDLSRPFMLTKYELFNDHELDEILWFLEEQFGVPELNFSSAPPKVVDTTDLQKHISKYMV